MPKPRRPSLLSWPASTSTCKRKNTINSTTSAKQFIDQQVNQTKEELDAVDRDRLDFMQKNVGNLPSEAASLVGQLTGLRDNRKLTSPKLDACRIVARRLPASSLWSRKLPNRQRTTLPRILPTRRPRLPGPNWSSRKADLESQLTRMLTELRPSILTCWPSRRKSTP